MPDYLYRYISFESFVDLIQKQALTFVLPELWEDPKESTPFFQFLKQKENIFEIAMFYAIHQKTYGQCWSRLAESDAMWRIYSFNQHAVQIKVSTEKLSLLPDVQIVPVKYMDNFIIDASKGMESFLESLAIKRTPFQHEEEVRLIRHYKFSGEKDLQDHIKSMLVFFNHPQKMEVIDSLFPDLPLEEKVKELVRILNEGELKEKTLEIPFNHISGFIEGVKVHPLAPSWYVDVVKKYCENNSLPFDGQSTLYLDE